MLTFFSFPGSIEVRDLNHLSPAADIHHSHNEPVHIAAPFHSASHGPDQNGIHRQPREHGNGPTRSGVLYSVPTFVPAINAIGHAASPMIESQNSLAPLTATPTTQAFPVPADPGFRIMRPPSAATQMLNPPDDRVVDVLGVEASSPILTEILFEETLTLREPTLLVGEGEPSATSNRASSGEATYRTSPQSLDSYTLPNVYDVLFSGDVISQSLISEAGRLDAHLATNESDQARAIDAVFVPALPLATADSLADQRLETDLHTDEAFIDIAEVLEDRFGWHPSRLRIGDRDAEKESADDHLPTNSATSHDSNELGWILRQLDRSHSPDDDVADQGRDMAELVPATRRSSAEGGMIELSHFHAPHPMPSAHGASVPVSAVNTDGIGTVEFVKTDSSCARYQAFELAWQLVDPTSTEPTLDEGSGESTPANLSPTSEDTTPDENSLDTDTRDRSASSSTKVSAASALFLGFFWRRRARRHRSRPQSA